MGHSLGYSLQVGADLALPDYANAPAERPQRLDLMSVPEHIGCKLLRPELHIRGRAGGKPTSGVLMPEAAVNEDHRVPAWKDKIRPTR